MLDHGSHIFVWHGSALASFRDCDAVRASCLDFAVRLSSGRFPLPDVRVVTQARPCANPTYIYSVMRPQTFICAQLDVPSCKRRVGCLCASSCNPLWV